MTKSKLAPAEKKVYYQKRNASEVMERDVQRKKAQWGALNENPEQWQSKRKWKNMPPMAKKEKSSHCKTKYWLSQK